MLSHIGLCRDEAWLMVGDFNELLNAGEKLGGPVREEPSFWNFRDMVSNCKVRELDSIGNPFSWTGWRGHCYVQCKLDRSFGNDAWFTIFPRSKMTYLDLWGSDHRPILIKYVFDPMEHARGKFCFDKRWLQQDGIDDIVRQGWLGTDFNSEIPITDRIANCRKALSKWKKETNQNSSDRLVALHKDLETEISKAEPDPQILMQLKAEVSKAYRDEERFWKQKTREKWLKDGDQNTRYFHNCVKGRRAHNRILMLHDENNHECYAEGSKGQVAVDYFRKMFTSTNPLDMEELFQGLPSRVTTEMNVNLTRMVSPEEIKLAAFAIKGSSAPGADGFTGSFYKRFWNIVGPSIVTEISGFFNSTVVPADWNHTNICLLPKKTAPTRMTDLRPISLCSVHYKIISKILCDRMKVILPEIISDTQGAFVPGRLITDNILVAHEVTHALRTDNFVSKDFMAIKTDMSKAYDRVEWKFLEKLMAKFGFHDVWIKWIMACITSVSYSVLLNGHSHGFIKPERGLRQGDPLSPFLFVLGTEALINVLKQSERAGRLQGISLVENGPSVHHLLFADDSLLLCKATEDQCAEIMQCLHLYGTASGQTINPAKSSIIFGKNIAQGRKRPLQQILGIEKEGGEGTYLGLPECFSGSKRKLLQFIHDKLKSRLNGWFGKALSQGGREILLKSIALALPIYAMSCFRLSKDLCQKLTSAMTQYWWSTGDNRRKIPWVAWKKLCMTKENGGIGFHDIASFNQALLCKQAWRLIQKPNSLLSRMLRSRYFPEGKFMECGVGDTPSYAWRSLLFGRELLKRGLVKSIGNGRDTLAYSEFWLFDNGPRLPIPWQRNYDTNLRVADLMIPNTDRWNADLLRELFYAADRVRIQRIKPSRFFRDGFYWGYTTSGSYTVKSGYKLLMDTDAARMNPLPPLEKALWSKIWKSRTSPKIKHFLWRCLSGALAVKDRLASRGMHVVNTCLACGVANETISHVLFHCPRAKEVWDLSCLPTPPNGFSLNSTFLNIHYLVYHGGDTSDIPPYPWLLWQIWKARNELVFEQNLWTANLITQRANEEFREWNSANTRDQTAGPSIERPKWKKPQQPSVKCNIASSWSHPNRHCGASWIVRNSEGTTMFHGRNAFINMSTRLEAAIQAFTWAATCLADMHVSNILFDVSELQLMEALKNPTHFPSVRPMLGQAFMVLRAIQGWSLTSSSLSGNQAAIKIANSVTKEHRYQSYIARGGPFWLHNLLHLESLE